MDTESKREYEKKIVSEMIALYCSRNHNMKQGKMCEKCDKLNRYARTRSDNCPFMETKSFCSNCRVHCYKPDMRQMIRTVMRFSGPRMAFYHPVMAIRHLIESRKEKHRLDKTRGREER